MLPSNLRKRTHSRYPAGAPVAQTGPYANGDDDDWMSPRALFMGFCCCLGFAAVVATLVLAAILLHRVVPPKALSDTCDDSNPCTLDFLETVRGVDSGCCSHCNLPNEAVCTNACYTSPQCVDGGCTGTCKGHCENSNALDCPIIHAVNLTALLDLGGAGNDGYGNYTSLYRECALSTCIYTIDILISNVTFARDAFVVSRSRFWRGNDTNLSATNETTHFTTFTGWDDFHSNIICLPMIAVEDRDCMRVIDMNFGLDEAPEIDVTCTYAYACSDPPSYTGSLEFPARLT